MDLENLSGADAQDIATNEQNEYYSALRDESHQSHAFVKSKVEAAYQRAFPERDKQIKDQQLFDVRASGPRVQPGDLNESNAEREAENSVQAGADEINAQPRGITPEMKEQMRQDLEMTHEQFEEVLPRLQEWMQVQCSTPEKRDAFQRLIEAAEEHYGRAGALKRAMREIG